MQRMGNLILVLFLGAWAASGHAQTYPVKPVRLINAFAPGGASDVVARQFASKLTEYLGQEVRTKRSGTIPGSTYLEWTNHLDSEGRVRNADELRALFAQHGITPDKEIIPFCGGGYRSAHAYLILTMLGYPRVRNYLGSWGEWGNRDETPIVVPEQ